jgi:hypothetical protein
MANKLRNKNSVKIFITGPMPREVSLTIPTKTGKLAYQQIQHCILQRRSVTSKIIDGCSKLKKYYSKDYKFSKFSKY